jgi:hypothetical protein
MAVSVVLLVVSLALVIASAFGKCPLWVPVALTLVSLIGQRIGWFS